MKAIQIQTDTTGNSLVWQETPDPTYGPQEVLVDVHASALNRADLSQRAGNYPPPPGASSILGLEMAGTIAEVGAEVSGWQVGDRVCALLTGGGYAERVAVPHEMLMPIPAGWSFAQAGAMPEAYYTAFVNLFMEAHIQPGESVLVHGGGSGVGTAAIQLLSNEDNTVFTTAGTDEKLARCRDLGATLAINYRIEDFAERIQAYTEQAGVDVILDMVGKEYIERNLDLLRMRGRLVFIAALSGGDITVQIFTLMRKRLRLIGSVLRARPLAEKVTIKEAFMHRFWSRLEDGTIQPVIDSIYPIHEANEAHQRMADNLNLGKIVLQVRE